ncbi:hypothetical protein A1D22_01070 [Pasteurellaceae bacterium LFhippo2]|nr:hypothetical protein [Pasteurellaceae bacterium LFhippo2]
MDSSSQNPKASNNSKVSYSSTATEKRINTTECNDSDDWYLDGYRVGKSFKAHKQKMFEERVTYCNYGNKLPKQFKTNWETGFKVGTKKS